MQRLLDRAALVALPLLLAAIVLPPLSRAAGHLFAAHMIQHLLLIAVAAPLLALTSFGRRLSSWLKPATAWTLFVCVFLIWHWPLLFRWAALSEPTRLFELFSILAAASLFWSVALAPPQRAQLSAGAAALYVMTAAIATDLPGVIMIFAPTAICTMPQEQAGLWGLTPLADQQLAGLFMWVPANLVFFSIALVLFARWMSDGPSQGLVTS